jgi:hypothetical protein
MIGSPADLDLADQCMTVAVYVNVRKEVDFEIGTR